MATTTTTNGQSRPALIRQSTPATTTTTNNYVRAQPIPPPSPNDYVKALAAANNYGRISVKNKTINLPVIEESKECHLPVVVSHITTTTSSSSTTITEPIKPKKSSFHLGRSSLSSCHITRRTVVIGGVVLALALLLTAAIILIEMGSQTTRLGVALLCLLPVITVLAFLEYYYHTSVLRTKMMWYFFETMLWLVPAGE